jgi:hypothetical protein
MRRGKPRFGRNLTLPELRPICAGAPCINLRYLSRSSSFVGANIAQRANRTQAISLAPKGLDDSAQGFNPGKPANKRFALKGRETIK